MSRVQRLLSWSSTSQVNVKWSKRKILPGYILVQVSKEIVEKEDGSTTKVFPPASQETIRYTANVLGFAGANKNKPRMMKPHEVENIFNLVDDTHVEVKSNVLTEYQEGDILDVVSGPLHRTQDVKSCLVQGDKILGQIDMFGRIVPAQFTKDQVYKPSFGDSHLGTFWVLTGYPNNVNINTYKTSSCPSRLTGARLLNPPLISSARVGRNTYEHSLPWWVYLISP